jgi:hypothetical protein
MTGNLTDADVASFARMGIPTELIEQARIKRITDAEARGEFGIRGGGDMAGIAFPYFEPATMANGRRRWYVRIRRDHPELEDGKEKKKYVAPYGDRKHFYFPPVPELFADVTVPIVLVEAEKSALAITAWAARAGRKVLPIAMGGCWGWSGKVGIKETPTGERVPEHGPIPDVGICRDGRKTYVLLDANCGTNSAVQQARVALVKELRKHKADVRVLDLPRSKAVNGPDDLLAVKGDEAMGNLLDGWVDGAIVFDDIEKFLRRFLVMADAQFAAVTLWIAHTHGFRAAIWTPYLALTSAAKRCGKSRALEVVSYLVHAPWSTSGASAASLFREIERKSPTLLLDEADALFKGDKEMAQSIRGVLNAGAHYKGTVARVVGKGTEMTTKDFNCFCPKAVAGIGHLPDTVADRSLHIRLERKLGAQKVERLRERKVEPQAAPLRERLSKWVQAQLSILRDAEPEIPEQLNDRQQDGAEFLLAIADAAGGEWPEKARKALVELYTGDCSEDQSHTTVLLGDIKSIFEEKNCDRISSGELLTALIEKETSPWGEWNRSKPLTAISLARLLKPFKIVPRTIRQANGSTAKGYLREFFEAVFERYLLPQPISPDLETSHPSHVNVCAGQTHFSETSQDDSVTGPKSEESPLFMRFVTDVTGQKQGQAPQTRRAERSADGN